MASNDQRRYREVGAELYLVQRVANDDTVGTVFVTRQPAENGDALPGPLADVRAEQKVSGAAA